MGLKEKRSKNLLESFKHAFDGIGYALKTVNNLKIHLLFTLLVILGGLFFKIQPFEWLTCLIFIALVISLELVNTAIEEDVNLSTLEMNIRAKHAKDVAAGAVLFSAIIAFIVGCIIFIPKIITFVGGLL